jgi:hypothetical protein
MSTTAVLNLGLNSKQFDKGLKRSEKNLIGFQKTTIGLGSVISAVATGAMARMGWGMIKMASDAEEVETKFTAVFKGIEKESEIVAKSLAKNFGLASSTAQQLLGDTGDILTGFGFARGEALKLSSDVNKLAIDLASFTNYSGGAKGASQALTKALLGETEQAKALGIVIRQGTPEFKERVKQIRELKNVTEQQARTQAIWEQIQKQSTNAMGDYARTADGTANRIRLMGERWKTLQEQTGKFLIEGLQVDKILGMISNSMKELADNAHTVKLAFESLSVDFGSGMAKTWIQTKGFLEDSIGGYKLLWTQMTGTQGEYNRLLKQIRFEQKLRKGMINGVEKHRSKKIKEAEKEWIKSEAKKTSVSVKEAENAIAKAIEKTTGANADTSVSSTTTTERPQKQLESAVLKGTVDAFKQENTVANKLQNDQLKELKKQTRYTEQTANNTSSTQVANF